MVKNGNSSHPGEKSIRVSGKLAAADYLALEFVAKRLGKGFYNPDRVHPVNVNATLAYCIQATKKELTEPTIKFNMDGDF